MRSQQDRCLGLSNDNKLFGTAIVDWKAHRADQVNESDLADAFYVVLDDAELREVFRDLMVAEQVDRS